MGNSLIEQIVLQAQARPDAVAVRGSAEATGYRALVARAETLAAKLARDGGDAPVGILDDRGPDRVAAMLGCMMAGRAYIPLEPALPAARLDRIAAQSRLQAIVAPERSSRLLSPALRRHRIALGDLPHAARPGPKDARPDSPLYILYTSGSTGEPKGVAMPEGPLRNLGRWQRETMPLRAGSRVLQFAPLAFDVASQEILFSLAEGGELVMVDEVTRRDPRRLMELIVALGVERAYLPVHALRLIAAENRRCPDVLRDVIVAGEPLTISPPLAHFFAAGGCRLHNHYGPTETHVVTAFTLEGDPKHWPIRVPAGHPIKNVEILLRDAALRPVRPGAAGEICVAGAALADGYHSDPHLTAQRFPLDGTTGRRMFRTGDIGRLGADGLEFLGRRDRQTKVRGVRVELDAVEAALAACGDVAEAAVVRPAGPGGGLRAFVVPEAAALDRISDVSRQTRLAQSRKLWDSVYEEPAPRRDPHVDNRGWQDSARRRRYSEVEIRDWADTTAARVRSLGRKRLLEIGCGSGMLITRLLKDCACYTGVDLSPRALTDARLACERLGIATDRLILACQPADAPLPGSNEPFDCVVLNSVTELLSDRASLLAVLETAIRQTAKAGVVFVGDVRNLALMEMFHAATERANAGAGVAGSELSHRIAQARIGERRLFVDPGFFRSIGRELPRVTGVELELRRDLCTTEMSQYRYDALLHLDGTAAKDPPVAEFLWPDCPPLAELPTWCRPGHVLCVSGIPNLRLAKDAAFLAALVRSPGEATLDAINRAAQADPGATDPAGLWDLASPGLDVRIAFMPGCTAGSMMLWLSRGARHIQPADAPQLADPDTNDPLAPDIERQIARAIRDELRRELPEVMIPHEIRVVPNLPLTRSGKIDRLALERRPAFAPAVPSFARAATSQETPADGGVAALLLECWREVLGQEDIDIDLGFFDHGGSSILLVELFEMLKSRLEGGIEFLALMRYPTIRSLSAHLSRRDGRGAEANCHDLAS